MKVYYSDKFVDRVKKLSDEIIKNKKIQGKRIFLNLV